MITMFWKKKKDQTAQPTEEKRKTEEQRRDRQQREYNTVLQQIDVFLSQAENDEVRTAILNYAIKVVKRDLIGDSLTKLIYGEEIDMGWKDGIPLLSRFRKEGTTQLDLSKTDVLAITWNANKLSGAIRDLSNSPFDQKKGNYEATYYPEIEFLIIINGIHHSAVASVGDGGAFDKYEVMPIALAFGELDTDGVNWIDKTENKRFPVVDFRFALLYTLAKMRYELENASASS